MKKKKLSPSYPPCLLPFVAASTGCLFFIWLCGCFIPHCNDPDPDLVQCVNECIIMCFITIVNGRWNSEASRLEVGNNKRDTARGSSGLVLIYSGMYERQLVSPLAFSCTLYAFL